jgi:glycosyltransferase involved in cell wall biosynthesis
MPHKLRIAIDCRISNTRQGVGTAVLALAKALSDSNAADQEYTFIVHESTKDWLEPYIYGPCKLKAIPGSTSSAAKAALRQIAPLRFLWKKLRGQSIRVPVSDGYVESQNFDVVHFPTQIAYHTNLPTIYQPWDLQHLHYPQFFSAEESNLREKLYRTFCDQASFVCVQTDWTKRDIIDHYNIDKEKIEVIPWGSVFDAYPDPSETEILATIARYSLPELFFFYPAVTWPHKNHEIILRALHILKSGCGLTPHVFFTGSSTSYRPTLDKLARDLGVFEQLHFLGFVTTTELQAIAKIATAMVFPSKFEGFGLPILEAFYAGLAVLSSDASTLPEVARDGALYFKPDSPDELSRLMESVWVSPELRQGLIQKGRLVLEQYSIKDMALNFHLLYEKTASR